MSTDLVGFQQKQRSAYTKSYSLRWLIEHGYISRTEEVFDVSSFSPPEGWMDMNEFAARGAGMESDTHRRMKVMAAVYLETQGCELPKYYDVDEQCNSGGWEYECFEVPSPHGKADVGCKSCHKYVECGTVHPKKCVKSLGFNVYPNGDWKVWKEQYLTDEGMVNVELNSTKTEQFITMPYVKKLKNEQREVVGYTMYKYEVTDKTTELL